MLLPQDFVAGLAAVGAELRMTLPDGRVATGVIEMRTPGPDGTVDGVSGTLVEPGAGRFFFQKERAQGAAWPLSGGIEILACNTAYRVETRGEGGSWLVAMPADAVVCRGIPSDGGGSDLRDSRLPSEQPTSGPIPSYQNGVVPLESVPGALGVAYLDFDGEPGPHFQWGNFNAASFNFPNATIREIWLQVAEDFAPFNINVTTDLAVYLAAPVQSRQRCIVTPTKDASPSAGGVAFIGSFNNSAEVSCWAFNHNTTDTCADTISHELGHTLGLRHDGRTNPLEDYYKGHGTGAFSWGPIMGSPFYKSITQWSKGEYTGANRTEDDLAIITGNNNNVDYRADDSGSTIATARYLEIQGTANAVSGQGIIETNTDSDAFRFRTTGSGSTSITVISVAVGPNLDLVAEIINAAGTVLATAGQTSTADQASNAGAKVTVTLPAGEYALRVSGTGRGDPFGTGFSRYGSIGAYSFTGNVANAVKPDRFNIAETTAVAAHVGTVTPRLSHGSNSLQYSILSGNTNGAFSIDPVTGQLRVSNSSAIDYESLAVDWTVPAAFELFVTLKDLSNPALDEVLRVVVTIFNVNEKPQLSGGSVVIPENLAVGTTIFTVDAADPDLPAQSLTYQITGGNTGGIFSISAEGAIKVATPPSFASGSTFNLTVRVADSGSPQASATATVAVQLIDLPDGIVPGGTFRTLYEGITGSTVASLTGHARFPTDPDAEIFLPQLSDSGRGSNLGSTIRAFLIVPRTGSYTFWVAGDDACQLLLSTDTDPSHATVRASNPTAVQPQAWTATSSQKSQAISLVAGQLCYLECRQKQSSGSEHIGVAWSASAGGQEIISRQVIPGLYLAPHSMNYRPRVDAAPITFFENIAPGNAVGVVGVTDLNPGQTAGRTITGGTGAALFSLRESDGLLTVTDPSQIVPGTDYSLNIRVKDSGSPALSGDGTLSLTLRSMGPVLSGLQVTSNPIAAGVTSGTGVVRRGQTAPIAVSPAAGEVFQKWMGGASAPASSSTTTIVDPASPGIAGANFMLMSVNNRTTPLPPAPGSNDFTWSLLGTGQNMDVVDDSGEGGLGGDAALRIDGTTTNFRGLLASWGAPAALEIGDTLSFTVDLRHHESPAADATGLIAGFTSSAARDQAFSVRLGTGGTSGFALMRDTLGGDSSPGTGSFASLATTLTGPAPASLQGQPVRVVFSIHRAAASSYTIGAAVGDSMATATSAGWPSYDSFFIRNGAISADFTIDNLLVSRSSPKKLTATFLSTDHFVTWVSGYPLAGPAALKDADPDGDGISNVVEMHLGLDPVDPASRLKLAMGGMQGNTVRLFANRLVTRGSFELKWSDSPAGPWTGSQPVPVSADSWNVEIQVARSGPRCFYRLTYAPPQTP